jgi:hypothetical protein
MMKRFGLLLLMLVLPIAVTAFGDTVILRNGTRYQGATITQSSRSSVAFTDQNGKNRSFAMKNVRSLQFGSSPAATLGKRSSMVTGGSTSRIISSGTEVAVRSNVAIDSKTAAVGQHFSATIDRDVLDNRGALAIPRGSGAQLFIESPSEGGTSPADLALDVDSITVNGTRYLIATNDVNEKGGRQGLGANKRTAEMVGGGAAIGTLIGALLGHGKGALIGAGVGAAAGAGGQVLTKGKAVQVPAETVLNFKLEQDLVLRPAR